MNAAENKTTRAKTTRGLKKVIPPLPVETIAPREVIEHVGYVGYIKTTWNLIIDLVFSILLRPLTREEFERLENSIVEHGFDPDRPIIIWNGRIIDGHHRYAICKKHNLPYYVMEKDFTSRKEAIAWIIENQADRRHSSKLECVYLFYEEYLATKKSVGAPLKSREMASDDDGTKSVPLHRTREKLAMKWKISPQAGEKWIKIGKAIDKIAMNDNKDAWDIVALLSDASHEDILKLARLRAESQKRVIDSIVPGINSDLAREILHDATHPKSSKHRSRESKKMNKNSILPIFLDQGFDSLGGVVGDIGCLVAEKYKSILPEKIDPQFLSSDLEIETHEWLGLDFPTENFGIVIHALNSMDKMIAIYDIRQDTTRIIAFVKKDAEIPESIRDFVFDQDGCSLGHDFLNKKTVKEPVEMPDEDEEKESEESEPEKPVEKKPAKKPAAIPAPTKKHVVKIPEEMPDEDDEDAKKIAEEIEAKTEEPEEMPDILICEYCGTEYKATSDPEEILHEKDCPLNHQLTPRDRKSRHAAKNFKSQWDRHAR